MSKLRVEVWSDIACPWCYVGKRRLEAALAVFPHRDEVEIVWRAFELDPSAPLARSSGPYAARLAKKYGMPVAQAEAKIAQMTALAAKDGLDFQFDRVQPTNTFNAHRVLHLAGERGKQDAMKERLLRAYMTEGEAIGEPEVLVRLASEAGLDAEETRAMLASDAYATDVRKDEALAREIGVNGVPFFLFGARVAVSGAQPASLLLDALHEAWKGAGPTPVLVTAERARSAASKAASDARSNGP